eukprot:SAG11_NODE_16067_length_557_cov_2.731441_1_plen_80_part_00
MGATWGPSGLVQPHPHPKNIAYQNNDLYRATEVGSSMGTVPLAIPTSAALTPDRSNCDSRAPGPVIVGTAVYCTYNILR